jgi:hypothetical protein
MTDDSATASFACIVCRQNKPLAEAMQGHLYCRVTDVDAAGACLSSHLEMKEGECSRCLCRACYAKMDRNDRCPRCSPDKACPTRASITWVDAADTRHPYILVETARFLPKSSQANQLLRLDLDPAAPALKVGTLVSEIERRWPAWSRKDYHLRFIRVASGRDFRAPHAMTMQQLGAKFMARTASFRLCRKRRPEVGNTAPGCKRAPPPDDD